MTEQGDDESGSAREETRNTTFTFQLLDAAVTKGWGWMVGGGGGGGEGVDCTRGEDFPALHLVTVMYGERCYCAVNE